MHIANVTHNDPDSLDVDTFCLVCSDENMHNVISWSFGGTFE